MLKPLLATLLTTPLLAWPALLNHYPILFSDTGGFLEQALMPDPGWDKPWIYGPFLTPFHLRLSLWPVPFAQALILSATLWLAQIPLYQPTALRHLAITATLALGTAAPWFAATLMPDILAPIAVLGLWCLARPQRWPTLAWLLPVTTIAIASHLAHLPLAAACIATLTVLGPNRAGTLARTASPLLAALALLLATNAHFHNRLAISPYGAPFALARLIADGPARLTIAEHCAAHPGSWRLCAWQDRLPTDSDAFLWDPYGPVWADSFGPLRIAPEAAEIVRETLLTHPGATLAAAARNTARQLTLTSIGDTLVPDHLQIAIVPRLEVYFPVGEAADFQRSRQANGTLDNAAAPFRPIHTAMLILGTLATATLATRWRQNYPLATLAALTLVALLANAAATGALSGPHDRYQARIAWLILLPALFFPPPLAEGPGQGWPPARTATTRAYRTGLLRSIGRSVLSTIGLDFSRSASKKL